jgi:hypothetical protein
MARRIHRGTEAFGKARKFFQDPEGAIRQDFGVLPWDSYPRYDLESFQSHEPKDNLIQASRTIAWRVLQEEQVLPLADLAHRIAEELMTNPNFTYRELSEALKADRRFTVTGRNLVSLSTIADPAEAYFQKMAKLRRRRRFGP